MFAFIVKKKLGNARISELKTPHGTIEGPFFQFVATQAAIRGLVFSEDLEKLGVQIVLANTYHLHLRPGEDVVAQAGGLHDFMQWYGPITTDSGGYQVFSLGKNVKLDTEGVSFRAPLDGKLYRLTPEKAIQIQQKLGADLIMPLDVCTPFKASHDEVAAAVDQTYEWAKRCLHEFNRVGGQRQASSLSSLAPAARSGASPRVPAAGGEPSRSAAESAQKTPLPPSASQALYGIVQGGVYPDLREKAAAQIRELGFFGYAIGGELREGQEKELAQVVHDTTQHLPEDAPRYLMGYGKPEDIVEAVRAGVDHFDCVLPIRNARHGQLYHDLNEKELERTLTDAQRPVDSDALYRVEDIMKSSFASDFSEFSLGNPAITKSYSKAYVHHLMRAETPSGMRLAVLHNIWFTVQLMASIRRIVGG